MYNLVRFLVLVVTIAFYFPSVASANIVYIAKGECVGSFGNCSDLLGEIVLKEDAPNDGSFRPSEIVSIHFNGQSVFDYDLHHLQGSFNTSGTQIIAFAVGDQTPGLDSTLLLNNSQIFALSENRRHLHLYYDNVVIQAAVPLPSSFWFLGSAILGVIRFKKRGINLPKTIKPRSTLRN